MRKKLFGLLATVSAVALLAVVAHRAQAAIGVCDPQRSLLCIALVENWNMNDAADSARIGSYRNTHLYEGDNVDVALSTATKKLGSGAAEFSGTNYLTIPRFGDVSDYASLSMWIYQTNQAVPAIQYLWITWNYFPTYSGSPRLDQAGSYFFLSAGKPAFSTFEDETDGALNYTRLAAITPNAWHLIVFKLSPYGPYGKAQACISVDNDAFTCGTISYNRRKAAADLTVGYGFVGFIDEINVWNRALTKFDVEMLYYSAAGAAGAGRAFPFY